MASFFRRKRSLIFKLILGIPALWFVIVIVLSFQSSDNDPPHNERAPNIVKRNVQENQGGVFDRFQNPIKRINQIVEPFNPFVNKVTKDSNVIKQDSAGGNAPGGNPDDRIIHKDFDESGKFRTSEIGPGKSQFVLYRVH